MRTLHFGLRVADLDRSLALSVEDDGPGVPASEQAFLFDPFVRGVQTLSEPGLGLGLTFVRETVEAMDATINELAERGIDADVPVSPDGSDDFRTTWVIDPDGNRIELVQWPADHADGITADDWAE